MGAFDELAENDRRKLLRRSYASLAPSTLSDERTLRSGGGDIVRGMSSWRATGVCAVGVCADRSERVPE